MSKKAYKSKRGESGSQYRQCVTPCPRFITSGDTHSLCVVCLGAKHAESALEGAGCLHCERLPIHTLRSRRTLFKEGVFASAPHGAGPASAEAERWLHSWGSQLDLAEGMEMGRPLSLSSPARSTARSLGSEARSAVSSPQRAGPVFHLSPSEEEDVESTGYSPTLSPQYEALLEVVTHAPRLQGSPEQLHRWLPAGPPCQGIDLAAPNTPEASLERLAPLVDYLAAWKLLPNVSRWVLQTVEKG